MQHAVIIYPDLHLMMIGLVNGANTSMPLHDYKVNVVYISKSLPASFQFYPTLLPTVIKPTPSL